MNIEVLRPEVVNQIAAGEVLDRPANLLKELIENSLDAGAGEIEAQFDGGGRAVSVRDNGCGMGREDLALCLRRFATSKIRLSDDLFRLNTYGFRGEALASIAAVSDLTVVSRKRGATDGFRVNSHFGVASEPVPVAAAEGCEIHVRDLFSNVPARLEFMKSESAEHAHIRATLKAFALAREDVEFRARSKGELALHWPKGQTFADRARDVLRNPAMFYALGEQGGFRIEAMVGSPRDTQAVNRNMWFFVQGRWVQDRSLVAAVMDAYRTLLMHGEFPAVVVRIQLDPAAVDVNVHPTKSAVKFRDPQAAFRAVSGVIRSVLEQAPWLEKGSESLSFAAAPSPSPSPTPERMTSFDAPEFSRVQYSTKSFPLADVRQSLATAASPTPAPVSAAPFRWRDLHVIGQAHLTYILAQSTDSMYMVDQHAAHERVVFEKLMSSFKAGRMDVQTLLLPLTVDLTEPEVEVLMGEKQAFEKLGLSVERSGPQNLVVQCLPAWIQESAVAEALKRAAHELLHKAGQGAALEMVEDLFATMACHSVVRAGQALSAEQMSELLAQMDEFPLSSFCPHGRPVFVRRRFQDIEREFGRIN